MLSIVIINWNTKDLLRQCLENIDSLRIRVPYEIVVVDNASSDGSREYLSARFMGRKILNTRNMGFGAACNLAVKTFTADAYLFLNTDAFPEKGAVDEIYGILMSADNMALVSPQLVNRNGSLQRTAVRFPALLRGTALGIYNFLPSRYVPLSSGISPELAQETDAVTGACMMVRRDIFTRMGGFDEDYFFFLEETDFCLRCRRMGYRVLLARRAKCVHLKGMSAGQEALRYRRIFLQSQFLFLKKHLPCSAYALASAAKIAGLLWKAFSYGVLNIVTLFLLPGLRRKARLYISFVKAREWREAEKSFTGIFRGADFYASMAFRGGRGYVRRDFQKDIGSIPSVEAALEQNAEVVKDAATALTAILRVREAFLNIKLFKKKRHLLPLEPSPASKAFYGAMVMKALRVPVPEIIGYKDGCEGPACGFFITVHDYGLRVLNFIFQDMQRACAGKSRPYSALKKKLASEVAAVFRRLHDAKVIHGDLKASNFLVRFDWNAGESPFEAHLIDLENIWADPLFFRKKALKNLAQLNKSFPDLSQVTVRDRIFFLKKYLGVTRLDGSAKQLVRGVEALTQRIFNRKKMSYFHSSRGEKGPADESDQ